jgi:hypothetical protein
MPIAIRITNAAGRDGTVQAASPARLPAARIGLPGSSVSFRRYLACTEACRDEVLTAQLGEDYAQSIIEGDPEVDIEHVGRGIEETNVVYLTAQGQFLHSAPSVVEIITAPDGTEKERRAPVDVEANVDVEHPVRWTGRKFPIAEAVRRFVFRRSLQVLHVDGVTYDFLQAMAAELARDKVLMFVGAGPKGADPLVFQANGRPCRGFLEGRVDGDRYQLMLHLSDMELKRPAPKPAPGASAPQE